MPTYNLQINGQQHTVAVDTDTPLLWVLRDHLNMVGTKYGVVSLSVEPVQYMLTVKLPVRARYPLPE